MNNQHTDHEIITAIDVGSSKIVALVARKTNDGDFECLGMSVARAAGIKDGVVVDLDAASEAIGHVVQGVQQESGHTVSEAIMVVGGRHVRSKEFSGIAKIHGNEVTQADIDRAIEAAEALPVSADDQILHTLVQGYRIDGQGGVKRPIEMVANRIEAQVLRIVAERTWISNLMTCAQRTGLKVSCLIPQALAASNAVLSDEDRMEGVCLVNIGSATTDLAVFKDGVLAHLQTIPSAGDDISSDIANDFHIPLVLADDYKIEHGTAAMTDSNAITEKSSPLTTIGSINNDLARQQLCRLIRAKAEELAYKIQDALTKADLLRGLRKGIVLTGGTANLPGIGEMFGGILRCPAHIATYAMLPHSDKRTQSSEYMPVVGTLWKYSR